MGALFNLRAQVPWCPHLTISRNLTKGFCELAKLTELKERKVEKMFSKLGCKIWSDPTCAGTTNSEFGFLLKF
jgi:hypothetical protein